MSFDIRFGLTKSYTVPLKYDQSSNIVLNKEDYQQKSLYLLGNTKNTIRKDDSIFLNGSVSAEHVDNIAEENVKVPSTLNRYYLYKTGSTYTYRLDKPYKYKEYNYYNFLDIIGTNITDPNTKALLDVSIKATRGLVYSKGIDANAYMAYSFPYGGISKTTPLLFYTSKGTIYKLETNEYTIIDLLEGVVYISQLATYTIDMVFGYFDIEPLKINRLGSIPASGGKASSFYKFEQKSIFGDISTERLSNTEYIITFSYNCFVVPSDFYFIQVDGINILNPLFILKNTPIYVKQALSDKRDSFLEESSRLFEGVESGETAITTFLKSDTSLNTEVFTKESSSAGLFIFKQNNEQAFDTTKATYLPLFGKQDIIKETKL